MYRCFHPIYRNETHKNVSYAAYQSVWIRLESFLQTLGGRVDLTDVYNYWGAHAHDWLHFNDH